MASQWQYQVRFDVNDSARRNRYAENSVFRVFDILAEQRAALKCQFDAFAEYVAAAEEHGVENYPLYQWTKATIGGKTISIDKSSKQFQGAEEYLDRLAALEPFSPRELVAWLGISLDEFPHGPALTWKANLPLVNELAHVPR